LKFVHPFAAPVGDGSLCKNYGRVQGGIMTDPSSASPNILYPEWQPAYQAALLELDRKQLMERVTVAETAIFNRLQVLSNSTAGEVERQAIEDALAGLRILKRENLGFPDWEKK
jgi:hypothetical protein